MKPALFIPIHGRWIDEALSFFENGNKLLYFMTDAGIGRAFDLPINSVYFKLKGTIKIAFKAEFDGLETINPREYRLKGDEAHTGKYYYGFKNLKVLKEQTDLCELRRLVTSGKKLKMGEFMRNDVPGACIILDPEVS
jgi:hypothetical protein